MTQTEQDALAERYRARLLFDLSPDDWYRCYSDPKLNDFAGQPMHQGWYEALRKARVSDAQLKPFLQQQVFNQFVLGFWVRDYHPTDFPKELLYNNCNHKAKPATPEIQSAARRSLLAELTKALGQVLQASASPGWAFLPVAP